MSKSPKVWGSSPILRKYQYELLHDNGTNLHDSHGVIVENGWNVLARELIGRIGDKETRFANGSITDYNTSVRRQRLAQARLIPSRHRQHSARQSVLHPVRVRLNNTNHPAHVSIFRPEHYCKQRNSRKAHPNDITVGRAPRTLSNEGEELT